VAAARCCSEARFTRLTDGGPRFRAERNVAGAALGDVAKGPDLRSFGP
jgi:hypothetical protein